MKIRIWPRSGLLAIVGLFALLLVGQNIASAYRWINEPFAGFFLYENGTVAPDFLPQWSGKKAGLSFLDRIVSMEDRAVAGRDEIYDLVRRLPAGKAVRYEVERGGAIFAVAVPTMKFGFFDWLLSYGLYLLIGLGFLAIGAAPFAHRTAAAPATT
ncbi:MAG: hypothetical protein ACREP8_07280, partial [Candidatus Binatia bacterium]